MKRIASIICLLALALTLAGCGKAGADPLTPAAPAAQQDAAPAGEQAAPADRAEPTPGPSAKVFAEPTAEPAAEPTPAPAAAPASDTLTREELETALNGAIDFYMDWFYDRSAVIDPAYSDFAQYPPFEADGSQTAYPAAAEGIGTYAELYAAACRYFDPALAQQLLDEIGAQDKDGQLCVYKSDGLGGVDYICELDVDMERRGVYEFDMEYAMAGDPERDYDTKVTYELKDGQWGFTARSTDRIHEFFVILLYASDLRTEYDLH